MAAVAALALAKQHLLSHVPTHASTTYLLLNCCLPLEDKKAFSQGCSGAALLQALEENIFMVMSIFLGSCTYIKAGKKDKYIYEVIIEYI